MPLKVYDGSGNNWHTPSMLEVPRSSDNCSGPLMRSLRRASHSDWLSFNKLSDGPLQCEFIRTFFNVL